MARALCGHITLLDDRTTCFHPVMSQRLWPAIRHKAHQNRLFFSSDCFLFETKFHCRHKLKTKICLDVFVKVYSEIYIQYIQVPVQLNLERPKWLILLLVVGIVGFSDSWLVHVGLADILVCCPLIKALLFFIFISCPSDMSLIGSLQKVETGRYINICSVHTLILVSTSAPKNVRALTMLTS